MTSSQQFREMCEGTGADTNLTQGGNSSNGCFDYLAEFISNIKGGIGPPSGWFIKEYWQENGQ